MTPDEIRECLPFHFQSLASKRLPEIIATTPIDHVTRTPVGALCATWCGNQVMAGSILCGRCRRAWYSIRLSEVPNRITRVEYFSSIEEWVTEMRRENLAYYGIPFMEQMWVFSW